MQEQEDMRNAEQARSTTRTPEKPLEEMMNSIRDSWSDLSSSDDYHNEEEEEDDEEDTELGMLS